MLDSTSSSSSKTTSTAPVVTVELKPGEDLSDQQLRILAAALANSVETPDYSGHPSNLYAEIRKHAEATYRMLKGEA